ncbi:MAG: hypothetical protein V5A21_13190 [Halapricum sp.]
MDETRLAVYGVTGLILAVTLLSGPLVGAVDLTEESTCDAPVGSGSATVTVDSLPEKATISKGKFGSEVYYLDVPDGQATVANVSGQPLLSYDLSIPEMGFSAGPTLFLCDGQSATQTLSIRKSTFEEEDIQADSYNATLSVTLRADGSETVVREKSITVEVEE